MENSLRAGPLALIAVLLIAAPAPAQPPLAEVARQEAARRASISEKSRFYTNDDLAGGSRLTTGAARRPAPDAAPPGSDEPADAAGGGTDDAPEAARGEAYWRERITAARDARQRAELVAAALQNRVDGLLAEFTGARRPGPAGPSRTPARRRANPSWRSPAPRSSGSPARSRRSATRPAAPAPCRVGCAESR